MVSYTWNGTTFDACGVTNNFFTDNNGNTWFYEQNYNTFFSFTVLNEIPTYIGNGLGQNLPAGTNLNSIDNYSQYITAFDASIISNRASSYLNNPSNILTAASQSTTAFIDNAIASNANLQMALDNSTNLLTSPTLNFSMKDISTNWSGGTAFIQQLQGFINNHQANITAATGAIQSISDFKKKILGQTTRQADAIRTLQGPLTNLQTSGTFKGLTAAFPIDFGAVNNIVNNATSNLNLQLPNFIPQSAASGEVLSLFKNIFGSSLPQITNPLDKILLDLNKLDSGQIDSLTNFPTNGFSNLSVQTNAVNQIATLLNNVVQNIPVSTQTGSNSVVTDLEQMFLSANAYAKTSIGQSNVQTTAAINYIQSLVLGTTAPSVSYNASNSTLNCAPSGAAADPAYGGSFTTTGSLSANIPSNPIYQPPVDITQSPDPTIAQNQASKAVAQTAANQSGMLQNVVEGNCINNINDVPLKPRSKPLDGSSGTYSSTQPIPF